MLLKLLEKWGRKRIIMDRLHRQAVELTLGTRTYKVPLLFISLPPPAAEEPRTHKCLGYVHPRG